MRFMALDFILKDWDPCIAIVNFKLQSSIPDFPPNNLKYMNIPQDCTSPIAFPTKPRHPAGDCLRVSGCIFGVQSLVDVNDHRPKPGAKCYLVIGVIHTAWRRWRPQAAPGGPHWSKGRHHLLALHRTPSTATPSLAGATYLIPIPHLPPSDFLTPAARNRERLSRESMSKISDVPSSASASTEHIDDNSYSDQQESHQTSGIERTYDAAMPLVVHIFNRIFLFVTHRSHARISIPPTHQEK